MLAPSTCARGQPLGVVPWRPPLQAQAIPAPPSAYLPDPWACQGWTPGVAHCHLGMVFPSGTRIERTHTGCIFQPWGRCCFTVDSVGVSTCWPTPPSPGPFQVPSPFATHSHLRAPVLLCLGRLLPLAARSVQVCLVLGATRRQGPQLAYATPWSKKAHAVVYLRCFQILINPIVREEISIIFHNSFRLVQLKMIKVSKLCQQ